MVTGPPEPAEPGLPAPVLILWSFRVTPATGSDVRYRAVLCLPGAVRPFTAASLGRLAYGTAIAPVLVLSYLSADRLYRQTGGSEAPT